MATRFQFQSFVLDSPTQVVPASVTFTLSTKVVLGGVGRLGQGFTMFLVSTLDAIPSVPQATANSGYVA